LTKNLTKLENQPNEWLLKMLKALVIVPNEKTKEVGALLAVARAEARKREHADKNPPILALRFLPELCIYVAVYEAQEVQRPEVKKQSG
jgi:hypothetical protein